MTLQELKKSWISTQKNTQTAIDWWNSKAASFASKELPTAENSLAMRLILDHNMVVPNCTALDIGCGAGRFSFALEQLGAHVTGTDFSPQMIDECQKQKAMNASSSSFYVYNWNTIDLHQLNWYKTYDLVLANMTPAITSADTFLKMMNASRNWCVMVKPIQRKNSIQDRLAALLGLDTDAANLTDSLLYAMELLWLNDKKPKVEYEQQLWKTSCTVDTAIQDYIQKLSISHTLSSSQKVIISDFLHSISTNSTVIDTTNTTIAAIYWQV